MSSGSAEEAADEEALGAGSAGRSDAVGTSRRGGEALGAGFAEGASPLMGEAVVGALGASEISISDAALPPDGRARRSSSTAPRAASAVSAG